LVRGRKGEGRKKAEPEPEDRNKKNTGG